MRNAILILVMCFIGLLTFGQTNDRKVEYDDLIKHKNNILINPDTTFSFFTGKLVIIDKNKNYYLNKAGNSQISGIIIPVLLAGVGVLMQKSGETNVANMFYAGSGLTLISYHISVGIRLKKAAKF